jgi:hypothetical protein
MNKKKLSSVVCNKCGRSMKIQGEIVTEGVMMIEYGWNYFSNKDGDNHKFDLCEACYDEMVSQFIVPVDVEKRVELM